MNIDLMSVFIRHHAYYIDAAVEYCLHGKEHRRICVFVFSILLFFFRREESIQWNITILLVHVPYLLTIFSILLTIYLYFSHNWHFRDTVILFSVQWKKMKRKIEKKYVNVKHCRRTYVSDILSIFHTYQCHHYHQIIQYRSNDTRY